MRIVVAQLIGIFVVFLAATAWFGWPRDRTVRLTIILWALLVEAGAVFLVLT